MTVLIPRSDGAVNIKIICSSSKELESTTSIDLSTLRSYLTGTLDISSIDSRYDVLIIEGTSNDVKLYGAPVEYETTICPG